MQDQRQRARVKVNPHQIVKLITSQTMTSQLLIKYESNQMSNRSVLNSNGFCPIWYLYIYKFLIYSTLSSLVTFCRKNKMGKCNLISNRRQFRKNMPVLAIFDQNSKNIIVYKISCFFDVVCLQVTLKGNNNALNAVILTVKPKFC